LNSATRFIISSRFQTRISGIIATFLSPVSLPQARLIVSYRVLAPHGSPS
jgi:hypothetical protein